MHDCKQEENIGVFKEFMVSTKGLKATIFTISMAILIQVGGFLYLYGGLVSTVNKNTEHLWKDITPTTLENSRNIDKILERIAVIRVVGIMGETGATGATGATGKAGKDAR
jgi:hypothetical protein